MSASGSCSISASELTEIKDRASSIVRLVAEAERLSHLADHWKAEAEKFEGMWRMECDLAASRVQP